MKVVLVTWADAYFSEDDDGKDHFKQPSVGWLITNNKKVVKLAQTYNEDGPKEVLTVPKAYVQSIEVLADRRVKRVKKKDDK